ncbi:uncharacterized protein LOC119454128 [Dermacentor silvarum]|uniref:uncharacterized protein LOC119454128 n=1 Tax=Dermacentor silvarum TaxID=543639 RepID=UPI0021010F4C|nr:uncharacterized protein LOC119454128 [Dermacentor silvarum]
MAKMWEFDAFLEDGDKDFASYVERFEHYCEVANVQEEKLKKSAFIMAIGKNAYKTLKDLLLPATPAEKSLEDLVKVLSDHYEPASRIIAERFRFNRRYQAEGETVATFAVALKHLAAKCKYGTFLDDALRDRFVAGLRNPAIQTGLLKKKELSFESACDFAKSVEMAEQESRGFRPGSGTEADVHAIRKTGRKAAFAGKPGKQYEATKTKCHRCGQEHDASSCRYRKARCYSCKRTGHLARVCGQRPPGAGKIHAVADQQEDNEMMLYAVHHAGLAKQPYQVELMLGRKRVQMQVDTGAAVSLISEDLWKQLVNPPPLTPSTVKLKTYGGAPLEVKGQAEVPVEYNGQRKILPVVVVPGNKPALLGRDWIENLDVDLNGIHTVQAELTADNLVKRCRLQRMPGTCRSSPAALREARRQIFLRSNAVQHVKTPPYHPASNGAAERLVQTVKKNLVRQLRDERRSGQARTIEHRLDQFLFTYRNTPCSTTGL